LVGVFVITSDNLTINLNKWIAGNISIENQLINDVYPLLRDIAQRQINKNSKTNVHTTLIVNELFLKLKQQNKIQLHDRNHFFAFSAKLVRQIIIDIIRSEKSLKRGSQYQQITLNINEVEIEDSQSQIDWLTIHNLLNELETIDPESVKLIELRFFSGLTIPEIAKVLNTSPSTISRNWKFAKSWLFNQLNKDD
jgi:RNA polymerase sigma factor (TIGR02999 family)